VDAEPTEDELRAFVASMLSNLDKILREPEVIDEAVREHRDLWSKLYRAASGFTKKDDTASR
jgi:hypothetical protein